MRPFGFRHKVLLLAVAVLAATQVVTLLLVLSAVRRDGDARARETVALAGSLFDVYMQSRAEPLFTMANALVRDYGFTSVVADGDAATIRSALANFVTNRKVASTATLLDLDGQQIASYSADGGTPDLGVVDPDGLRGWNVVYFGGRPHWTVTVEPNPQLPDALVMLGFAIDAALAAELAQLTGLEVSFVSFDGGVPQVYASTLPADLQPAVLAGLEPARREVQQPAGTAQYLAAVRPFLAGDDGVYVALHLSPAAAAASYQRIRNVFLLLTGLSLALAIGGSFWLANTVTRPVGTLVAAARRMREGVYNEPLNVQSSDELGELAASFNAMQAAIADRERHIFHQAHHDSLSGLPTRELVVGQLRDALVKGRRYSVVTVGLDRFGGIVSSLGHHAGDELIKRTAGALRNRLADGQILGHLSDHEFVVGLPDAGADEASEWVEYQADFLRSGVKLGGANVSLQVSGGVACYPDHSTDAAELCRRASSARSDALARHETVAVYRLGQEDQSLRQIKLVGDFTQAVAADQLRLYLQPKLDCRTREVCGAEALVRWQHPELGLLTPDGFVGAIEQAGRIAHLTRWVLRRAVGAMAAWRQQGIRLTVAVNISVDDLADEYLPYFLLDLVKQQRLAPKDLTLEVTESAIMHNVHKSLAVAGCIRELGFRIAVDDFGTGQSALAQLKRLPLDELKIDKSFVMGSGDPADRAILKATVELGHELGLGVVAEGVEDDAALDHVTALGCEHAQGYGIGKPMPEAEFPGWLARWQARRAPGVVAIG